MYAILNVGLPWKQAVACFVHYLVPEDFETALAVCIYIYYF